MFHDALKLHELSHSGARARPRSRKPLPRARSGWHGLGGQGEGSASIACNVRHQCERAHPFYLIIINKTRIESEGSLRSRV